MFKDGIKWIVDKFFKIYVELVMIKSMDHDLRTGVPTLPTPTS